MKEKSVLLFASRGDEAERIADFCRRCFEKVDVYHGDWGQPFPEVSNEWEGDFVISYCSRWIIPSSVIYRATIAALNFHPAPPEFPGVGGLNWALYSGQGTFGVTCHRMLARVDAGPIAEVRRFPILPSDDVESLFKRTHLHLEVLALDTIARLSLGEPLEESGDQWSDTTRTRNELNELATINVGMDADEIDRRIRATNFRSWKPTITIGRHEFELKA